MSFTVRSLFQKLQNGLTKPNKDIVFDLVSPGTLKSMTSAERENGGDSSTESIMEKVLVMIEVKGDGCSNIPFSLSKLNRPNPLLLLTLIKRLKKKSYSGVEREQAVFLTNTSVTNNEKKINDLMTENDLLQDEIRNLKTQVMRQKAGVFEQQPSGVSAVRDREEQLSYQKEIKMLKQKLTDLEIEFSIVPNLKTQLKEKNAEVEILNMYIREVEICHKIRAPIPKYSDYKLAITGKDGDGGSRNPTSNAPPLKPRTSSFRTPGMTSYSSKKSYGVGSYNSRGPGTQTANTNRFGSRRLAGVPSTQPRSKPSTESHFYQNGSRTRGMGTRSGSQNSVNYGTRSRSNSRTGSREPANRGFRRVTSTSNFNQFGYKVKAAYR